MPPFSYAKPPVFQYQVFDRKTVAFTSVPAWKPPTPPPPEPVEPPDMVPPGAPGEEAGPAADSPADDVTGEYMSSYQALFGS